MPCSKQKQIKQMIKQFAQKRRTIKNISEASLNWVVLHRDLFIQILKDFLNILSIFRRIIQIKNQFRNMSYLILNPLTKMSANLLYMTVNLLDKIIGIGNFKQTQINFYQSQIRTNLNSGDSYKSISIIVFPAFQKDLADFLLNQSRIFILTCRIHRSE